MLYSLCIFLSFVIIINGQQGSSDITQCDPNVCENGICWSNGTDYKNCYCYNGFTGFNCEINYDECRIMSCENGGNCTDSVADIECRCPSGFTGQYCENEIDACESNPCHNGGICSRYQGQYLCKCLTGFSGINCENDATVCEDIMGNNKTRCENGAMCLEMPGLDYRCQCTIGYQGERCEQEINICEPNMCQNNGTCIDLVAQFKCQCRPGFTGELCHYRLTNCLHNPCENNAICLRNEQNETDFHCLCYPGFFGVHCERHYNECLTENPCHNQGSCVDGVNTYSCLCNTGFTGSKCEINCSTNKHPLCSPNSGPNDQKAVNITSTEKSPQTEPATQTQSSTCRVYSAHFNGKQSFLIFGLDERQFTNEIIIEFDFKSDTENGVLFSTRGTRVEHFLAAYVTRNETRVTFGCDGKHNLLISSTVQINDGKFHHLWTRFTFNESRCEVEFSVDRELKRSATQNTSDDSVTEFCFHQITFGGYLDRIVPILSDLPLTALFEGCIREINFDKQFHVKECNQIRECGSVESVCLINQCSHHGQCLIVDNATDWHCQCDIGFHGERCQRATCKPNPCDNGGFCLITKISQFICVCSGHWFGDRCQYDFNSTLPGFGRNLTVSSMIYSLPFNVSNHLGIRFRMLIADLNQNNTILLRLMAQRTTPETLFTRSLSFLKIYLNNSTIFMQINLDNETRNLSLSLMYKRMHTIYLGFHRKFFWLIANDNQKHFAFANTRFSSINIDNHLTIGGESAENSISINSFQGCIFDLEARNDSKISFIPLREMIISTNIADCEFVPHCKDDVNNIKRHVK